MTVSLEHLSKKLQNFGKDNLSDIMHFTATGFKDVFNCKTVRIYLEDLYEGMLITNMSRAKTKPMKIESPSLFLQKLQ